MLNRGVKMQSSKVGQITPMVDASYNLATQSQVTQSHNKSSEESSSLFKPRKMQGPHFVHTSKNDEDNRNEKELAKWFKVKNYKTSKLALQFNRKEQKASSKVVLNKGAKNTNDETRSLEFVFNHSSTPNDSDMFHISKDQKNFSMLKNFSLQEWDFHSKVTNKGYREIAYAIQYLKWLTALSLVLCPSEDAEPGVRKLIQSLEKLAHLTQLSITFPYSYRLKTSVITDLSHAIKHFTKLTKFALCLRLSNDKHTEELAPSLSKLANNLQQLGNLESLSLAFPTFNLPQQSLIDIANTIKQLTKLLSLRLDLRDNEKLNDEAIIVLANNLKFTQLKSLSLNLAELKSITELSLFTLADTIRGQAELSSCNINISECTNINEAGIVGLIQSLGALLKLTQLELHAGQCKITNSSLKELGIVLRNLSSLTKLNINLIGCNEITERGLSDLAENLKYLRSLAEFKIILPKTGKVTEANRNQMIKIINNLKLEKLTQPDILMV
jgi:hypothetical protein